MIAELLLKIVMKERPRLSKKKQEEFTQTVREAIANNSFFTIRNKDDDMVGFFTFTVTNNYIYINNLYILKQYRNNKNLLPLRKKLRKLAKFDKGQWFNFNRQHEYNFSLN